MYLAYTSYSLGIFPTRVCISCNRIDLRHVVQVRAGEEISAGKQPASPSLQESHRVCCCEVLLTLKIGVQTAPLEEAGPQMESIGHRKKAVQKQQGGLCGLDTLCQAPARAQTAARTSDWSECLCTAHFRGCPKVASPLEEKIKKCLWITGGLC